MHNMYFAIDITHGLVHIDFVSTSCEPEAQQLRLGGSVDAKKLQQLAEKQQQRLARPLLDIFWMLLLLLLLGCCCCCCWCCCCCCCCWCCCLQKDWGPWIWDRLIVFWRYPSHQQWMIFQRFFKKKSKLEVWMEEESRIQQSLYSLCKSHQNTDRRI